jgi:2'-5' RNA ligase
MKNDNRKDRYVIVCLFHGDILEHHEKITSSVCSLFNVKRQKLPAHFTIKAPFEYGDISELEEVTKEFCASHLASPLTLSDYGHFRNSVVFMDVQLSKEAEDTHNNYIECLKKINWLEWKDNEKKHKVFHCTIVTKLFLDKFKEIWDYVIKYPYKYNSFFDNISIDRKSVV